MALVQCQECGHEISSRAFACPSCGCPASTAASSHTVADATASRIQVRIECYGSVCILERPELGSVQTPATIVINNSETISLHANPKTTSQGAALASLAHVHQLRRLDLDASAIAHAISSDMPVLCAVGLLSSVETLRLRMPGIASQYLAVLHSLYNLRELVLGRGSEDVDGSLLMYLVGLRELRRAYLVHTQIDASDVERYVHVFDQCSFSLHNGIARIRNGEFAFQPKER